MTPIQLGLLIMTITNVAVVVMIFLVLKRMKGGD